jgi:hypothetical protein
MPTKKQTTKKRSLASRKRFHQRLFESDGEYLFKLVLCVVLGTLWLKFSHPFSWIGILVRAFPLGLVLGLIFVSRFERFQEDRKIWYAVLIVIAIISYFVPAGIVI